MTDKKTIDIKKYCDSLFTDLTGMKSRLFEFVGQIDRLEGAEKELLGSHIGHLNEIIDTIGWKLDILTKACPYEWKGLSKDVESSVSVPAPEPEKEGKDFSGGYVGG